MPWLAVARARTPSVAATTWAETTSHTLARTRISGAVCRSRRVRARVARSVTSATVRAASAALAQRPERGLAGLAGEPVEEHLAVEVVDLVLQRAGHQAGARQPQRLAVHVEALDDGLHRPHRGRPQARDGQAALVAVLGLLGQLDDPRVDQVADLAVDVVAEDPGAHPDLRGGQPGAAGVVDGLLEVAHQGGEFPVEGPHLVGGRAEHGVTELADGADRHRGSLPAARGRPTSTISSRCTTSRRYSGSRSGVRRPSSAGSSRAS